MRGTKRAIADAAGYADDFHICATVCDVNFDLFRAAHGIKARRATDKRSQTRVCETCRHADGVLLRNSAFDKLAWKKRREIAERHAAATIGSKRKKRSIHLRETGQLIGKRAAYGAACHSNATSVMPRFL